MFGLSCDETFLETLHYAFRSKGFIENDWSIPNWNKRQYVSDSSTQRVRKYRENRAQKQDETFQKRYETEDVTDQNRTEHKKPTSAHRVRAVDVKVKKKTKSDLKDARYVSFKEAIRWYWDAKNPGIEMPWGPPDGKQLNIWLTECPGLSLEQFRSILRNRLKSPVTHSDRIYTWIRKASSYLSGPVNAYGRPAVPISEPKPQLTFVRDDGSPVVPQ